MLCLNGDTFRHYKTTASNTIGKKSVSVNIEIGCVCNKIFKPMRIPQLVKKKSGQDKYRNGSPMRVQ